MICRPCRDWADAPEDGVRLCWFTVADETPSPLPSVAQMRRQLHEADCEGAGQCDCQHKAKA